MGNVPVVTQKTIDDCWRPLNLIPRKKSPCNRCPRKKRSKHGKKCKTCAKVKSYDQMVQHDYPFAPTNGTDGGMEAAKEDLSCMSIYDIDNLIDPI